MVRLLTEVRVVVIQALAPLYFYIYAVRYWCFDRVFRPTGRTRVRGVVGPNNTGLVIGWHFLWQSSRFMKGVVLIPLDGGVILS